MEPGDSSAPTVYKRARPLACVLCQQRKIKCDRAIPCGQCVKADVTCTQSKPAPVRPRTKPRQDLQQRLARCEELLSQYAGGKPVDPSSVLETFNAAPDSPSNGHAAAPGKMVFEKKGGGKFVDGQLWTTVHDEIQIMRNMLESEGTDQLIDSMTEDMAAHTISEGEPAPDTQDLDPAQAIKLWQLFLIRVDPLTKIIHVPTVQEYLPQAITAMHSLPLNYQALFWAIFGMATLSMSDEESQNLLGQKRQPALRRPALGLKQALKDLNFLKNYDSVIVQALTFALIFRKPTDTRESLWVLSGMLVRMSVSMGYHIDGEELGLSPFDTEMRRRLWWQVVIQDGHLTVSNGFKNNLVPRNFTTKPPLNLNDADIFPGATEPFQSREGPTEMGFMLVFNRLMKFFLDEESRITMEAAIFKANSSEADVRPEELENLRQAIEELNTDLQEIERRYINPEAGNHHRAVGSIRPIVLDRLYEILAPSHRQPGPGSKDKFFRVLVLNSENITQAHHHMVSWGYFWLMELHFHSEILAALTSQLCQRPMGSLSDRGWAVLERTYEQEPWLLDLTNRENIVQAQFTVKAFDVREKAAAEVGRTTDTPEFIKELRKRLADWTEGKMQQSTSIEAWMPDLDHELEILLPTWDSSM